MFITVRYSCKECGLVAREVIVPARRGEEEDVVSYMRDVVMDCVQTDHRLKSPACRAAHLQDLMIPLTENKPIGCA